MRRTSVATLLLAGASALAADAAAQAPSPRVRKSVPSAGAPAAERASAANAGPETAAFVVTLGSDTTAVERYTRTTDASGTRIEGDVVNRAPNVRVTHYVVRLDAQGRPTEAEYATRRPDGTPLPNGALGVKGRFANDSAIFEAQLRDSTARLRAPAPAGTILSLPSSYAMWEIGMRQLRMARTDTGTIRLWGPGAPQAQPVKVRMIGADSATVDYFGDPLMLRVDREGRILGVDGARTTNKSVVRRVADVDVAAMASAFAARPAMGQTSPRDTVRATVGAAQLLVDYSRPSVRGRTVWGGTLVPYGQIWRTGANAATQFRTSADLVIGGQPVPAGTYTLFTLPTAQGTQLVVNKQTGQWGTEYKPEMDLVRIPLTATTLATPTEQFTIALEPTGATGGTLAMRWGTMQFAVPFTLKP